MSQQTTPDNTKARQHWMSVLARASLSELEAAWEALPCQPEYAMLRQPETGLVMVQARTNGSGAPFNMGEMTLTRCAVSLNTFSGTNSGSSVNSTIQDVPVSTPVFSATSTTSKGPEGNASSGNTPSGDTPKGSVHRGNDATVIGHAYIAGRSKRHAELAAVFDGLLQQPEHGHLTESVIAPMAERIQAAQQAEADNAAATKVDFFTMVRGED